MTLSGQRRRRGYFIASLVIWLPIILFFSLTSEIREIDNLSDTTKKGVTTTALSRSIVYEEFKELKESHIYNGTDTDTGTDTGMASPTREPVLPSKVFTIVGLEDSGSTFFAQTIARALGLTLEQNRKDARGFSRAFEGGEGHWTHMQHKSLPAGSTCEDEAHANLKVIPVFYPYACNPIRSNRGGWIPNQSVSRSEEEACRNLTGLKTMPAVYPNRYFLNISSHLEWYLEKEVDIRLIIIVRDTTVSKIARSKSHCRFPYSLEVEEALGVEIMTEAVRRYINANGNLRQLSTSAAGYMGSSDGKVMMVSYEMISRFGYDYLSMIYDHLGIKSSYNPGWRDANGKYVLPIKKEVPNKAPHQKSYLKGTQRGYLHRPDKAKIGSRGKVIIPRAAAHVDALSDTALSLLPSKVFTVVGLESSGTTFLAQTISKALNITYRGDNARGFSSGYVGGSRHMTEVQHVSLPFGSACIQDATRKDLQVVPVRYPLPCILPTQSTRDACRELRGGDVSRYPGRWFLNVSSHLEWFREKEVDTYLIIVVRDKSISQRARQHIHCKYPKSLEVEEALGFEIMTEALHRYISRPGDLRQLLSTSSTTGGLMGSSDGKVVLVSYETMNRFGSDYLKMLFRYLGVETTFQPIIKDGNVKHVNPTILAKKSNKKSKVVQRLSKRKTRPGWSRI